MSILKKIYSNLKIKKRAKFKYTKEMQEQDSLWENQQEDYLIMEKLYMQIVKRAVELGFNGEVHIYEHDHEMLCTIFRKNKQEEDITVGYCKPLIDYFEDVYFAN